MITFEPYQERAVNYLVSGLNRYKRIILVSPAGSGKTLICAGVVRRMKPRKCLWITPSEETRNQGRKACELSEVSEIVDCVCFQGKPSAEGYDMLIIDEAHGAGCNSIQGIIDSAADDCLILGVTATPDRTDDKEIIKIIGPIFHTVSRADVMATGRIVSASVRWLDVPGSIAEEVNKAAAKEIRGWMSDEQRNRIIYRHAKRIGIVENQARNQKAAEVARRAMDAGRSVLVLVAEKAQGNAIVAMIGKGAVMVHSGMKKREETIEKLRRGDILCAVATSLADCGMDVPIISVLVMACGGRAAGRTEQRVGRAARNNGDGLDKWVFDFVDSGHFFLSAQSKARRKVYKTLGLKEA